MNKEKLEEYIEKYSTGIIEPHIRTLHKMCFRDGAEWQAEQMYSSEEVLSLLCDFFDDHVNCQNANITQWFNENNKK